MSWKDRESRWVKTQVRNGRFWAFITTTMVVVAISPTIMILDLLNVFSLSLQPAAISFSDVWFISVVPFVFFLPFVISNAAAIRRVRRTRSIVPTEDGGCCPQCYIAMKRMIGNADQLQCPRCESVWSRSDLIKYWEQWVHGDYRSSAILSELRKNHKNGGVRVFDKITTLAIGHRILFTIILFSILAISIAGVSIFAGASLLEVIFYIIPAILAISGGLLISSGNPEYQGDAQSCAECKYPKHDVDIEDKTSQCPECAAFWNEPGQTVHGTLTSESRFQVAGLVCGIAAILWFASLDLLS